MGQSCLRRSALLLAILAGGAKCSGKSERAPVVGGSVADFALASGSIWWTKLDDGWLYQTPISGGSAVRVMPGGFVAAAQNVVVAVDGAAASTLWSVDPAGGSPRPVATTPFDGYDSVATLAVDASRAYVVVTKTAVPDAIYAVNLSGQGAPTFLATAIDAAAMASDGTTVFWTESRPGFVKSVPAKGGPTTVIASAQMNAAAIVVDDSAIYWAVSEAIIAVAKGGGSPTPLVSTPSNPNAQALAVDASNLYWVAAGPQGSLMKVPKGGGTPTVVVPSTSFAISIAVDDVNVYWLEFPPESPANSVFSARK